ncbi:MAG: SPFH domain-containing protein [Planctomycetota bacterium]
MAHISSFLWWRHLRAQPNQHILHFRGGRLVSQGPGLAYWFNPLSAAVAQLPVEDCETTFALKERSSDFQEVTVQVVLTYRVTDAVKAAGRVNFGIDLNSGAWTEQPLERLASTWSQRGQNPTRAYLSAVPVVEAVRAGGEAIRTALAAALRADTEISAMGLQVVDIQVIRVAPSAELEKALQSPTREAIQQKADEAGFSRRANAVEKERVIKENEINTEFELAKRQEQLIEQQGRNKLLTIEREAQAARRQAESAAERQALEAEAYAKQVLVRAKGDAEAHSTLDTQTLTTERERVGLYSAAPSKVVLGFALQKLAGSVENIQHLNITPDLMRDLLHQSLTDGSGASGNKGG